MKAPEQWPKVKEIVGAALECDPGSRKAYLDGACSHDEQLRSEVDSLIAAYERADDLSSPGRAWDTALQDEAEVAQRIGPYTLERELGAGGMGQVWLAEQTEPVHRKVALKLIRTGLANPQLAQRFLAERQSLALMNHPAIAKVFDAGTTSTGQPYLVMEYVEGCTITEYCDRHMLTIAERLRLFQQVCDGVQHAHQKAIIHRDLKPSNILVTEIDGKPTPRIIDFGIAKAMSDDAEAEAMFTQVGSVVGTLGYMSPEQADESWRDIDTRTDVYSLGVVLYELLVGTLPVDPRKLDPFERLRRLREEEAPRPSTRLRSDGDHSAAVAQARSTEVQALTRELRGDLDAIALKTLEKDRKRRYATPSALAADISNFLSDEPVDAHAPGVTYRAGKYIRRHRLGVAMAGAAVLLLASFAVVQAFQLQNIRRQRDRADRITTFMTNMFAISDPSEARGNSITVREMLDKSSHDLEHEPGLDSTLQAQLMAVLAKTYTGLGLYGRAQQLEQHVLESEQRQLGLKNARTLESMTKMGEILSRQGKNAEAETMMRKTADLESRILGPEASLTLETKDDLAALLEKNAHYREAETLEREGLAIETRRLGAENAQTFRLRNTLSTILGHEGRFAEAEKEDRQLIESERRVLGEGHPYLLTTMHNLGNLLSDQGHNDEAEAVYRDALRMEQHVLGPEHPDTVGTMTTLANTLAKSGGRGAEAEALYRKALEIQSRTLGPDHNFTTKAKEGLGNELSAEQHYAEADELLREVLATRERTLGPDHTDTLLTQYNVAEVEFHLGQLAEAESLARSTLQAQSRVLDANDPDTMASKSLLARILLADNRFEEAATYAGEAYDAQFQLLGPQHDDTQDSLVRLAKAYVGMGRYAEAKASYLDNIKAITQQQHGDVSYAWYNLATIAAVARHSGDAFFYLHNALLAGYTDMSELRTDNDLKPLHKDPRFVLLLAAMQKQAVIAAQKR